MVTGKQRNKGERGEIRAEIGGQFPIRRKSDGDGNGRETEAKGGCGAATSAKMVLFIREIFLLYFFIMIVSNDKKCVVFKLGSQVGKCAR